MVLSELKDRLKTFDETTLLEVLQINADLLVERFSDIIEENYDELVQQLSEDEQGVEDETETD